MKKSFLKAACVMAVCTATTVFTGCASIIEKVEPTTVPVEPEPTELTIETENPWAEELPTLDPSGGMVGSRYFNEMFGFEFSPGETWICEDMTDSGGEDGLVMYAMDSNTETASNIQISVQQVSDTGNYSAETFAQAAQPVLEESFPEGIVSAGTMEFAGQECACNDVTASVDGTGVYAKAIYIMKGEYVATVVITTADFSQIEDIVLMFSQI